MFRGIVYLGIMELKICVANFSHSVYQYFVIQTKTYFKVNLRFQISNFLIKKRKEIEHEKYELS